MLNCTVSYYASPNGKNSGYEFRCVNCHPPAMFCWISITDHQWMLTYPYQRTPQENARKTLSEECNLDMLLWTAGMVVMYPPSF